MKDWCDWFDLHWLPSGCVLGVVDVVDVRFRGPVKTAHTFSNWHDKGATGIYVANPKLLVVPKPWRGQQSIFRVPDDELLVS